MADTVYLSQKTISFNIFANKLLHNPNAYWYNDIVFDDQRGAICDIFKDHAFSVPGGWCLKNDIVEGSESPDGLPTRFALAQNFPNPFNGQTRIEFSVADAGDYEFTVYDILGRIVHSERFGGLHAGTYVIDISDDTYGDIASGVYFYQVGGQTETITKKMLLIK